MKIEYEGRGTHLKVTQTSCKPSKFVVAPEYFHEYSKKKNKKKCTHLFHLFNNWKSNFIVDVFSVLPMIVSWKNWTIFYVIQLI